ncbi:MAG TPA: PP2C family serine/threonine-protein phosphatase [Actinomycetota bacterium]|nr:PP2C family serine/threonine-protein phosphatase [Actinomycetota bacterium]
MPGPGRLRAPARRDARRRHRRRRWVGVTSGAWCRNSDPGRLGPAAPRPGDPTSALRGAALHARDAILTLAKEEGEEARSYASTLLLVAVTPRGGGALQIGDGVMVVGTGGDGWSWMFWPQRGEYANTTFFLTDDDAPGHMEVGAFGGTPTDVAVMTNGLEPLALHYASRSVHEPFFEGMFQPLVDAGGSHEIGHLSTSLETFLSSERIRGRTDDDVSLILATRRSAAVPT